MYSDSKARMFLRRGYSLNKINQSLRNKGIENKHIRKSIDKIKDKNILNHKKELGNLEILFNKIEDDN